jgi:hypothetical protein
MIKRRIAAAAAGLALVFGGLAATSSATDDTSANGLKFSIGQSASQDSGAKANGSRANRLANGL